MWGVNGVASVLGGLGAKIFSVAFGFRWTMGLAILAYLLAAAALFRIRSHD